MRSWKLYTTIGLLSLLGLTYQNCAGKFHFAESKEEGSATPFSITRQVTINPTLKSSRPEIRLSTIMDNSYSVEPIQQQIRNAFDRVVKKMRGFDGQLSLYTTTQDDSGKNPSFQYKDVAKYFDGTQEVTIDVDQIGNLIPKSADYTLERTFLLSNTFLPNESPLKFDADMEKSQFEEMTETYLDSITQLGVEGSDQEQGLCTLFRIIDSVPADDSSFQAFILTTNEDDSTSLEECLAKESTPVKRTPAYESSSVPCQPGEAGCTHQYEWAYKSNFEKELSYQTRYTKHYISYESELPSSSSYKMNFQYKQYRTRLAYNPRVFSSQVQYKKYCYKDNLRIECSGQETKKIKTNSPGKCLDQNGVPVDSVDRACLASDLSQISSSVEVVPNSCRYTCNSKVSSSTVYQTIQNYNQPGTCSSNGIPSSVNIACSNPNTQANCQERCNDRDTSKSLTLNNAPSCVTGSTRIKKDTKSCTSSQLNSAVASVSGLSHNLVKSNSCKVELKCNYLKKSYTMTSEISNSGVDPVSCLANSGTRCEDISQLDLEAIADSKTGSLGTYSCNYSCTSRTANKVVEGFAKNSCGASDDNTSCGGSDANSMRNHYDNSYKRAGYFYELNENTCKVHCDSKAPPKCKKELNEGNLCNSAAGLAQLENACGSPGGLEANACRQVASFKQGSKVTSYKSEKQDSTLTNLTQTEHGVEGDILETLKEKLTNRFGDNFYLAMFVPTPEDKNGCVVVGQGEKYSDLAEKLGGLNSSVFPVCQSDYSSSLGLVLDRVVNSVKNSYILELNPNEAVVGVAVVDANDNVQELESIDWSYLNNVLTFSNESVIANAKKILLDVQKK